MKKTKLIYKAISLSFVFFLSACGYSLNETYGKNEFNYPDFCSNYYKHWDNAINYHDENNKITNKDVETIKLDKTKHHVFEKSTDTNFEYLEANHNSYSYYYDRESQLPEELASSGVSCYGPAVHLGKNETSFRYGYISKLFDGQMFCNGDFEGARVQIDENGFGCLFDKEYYLPSQNTYFAINFKSAVEFKRNWSTINIPSHKCDIEITVNFYCKNDKGYSRIPVSYEIDNVPTNTGDMPVERGYDYTFFGFELNDEINIERCIGMSIEYKLLKDETMENLNETKYKDQPLHHSLLLYEVVMPGSIWH